MVKFLSWLALTFSCLVRAESTFHLITELSKDRVYQGETFTVTFFLESKEDRIVEVEVMKFPEFRGFWSENILLRQGPLHLSSMGKRKGSSRAAVGGYTVQSILGTSSPSIEPMRILIRSQGAQSVVLESSPASLTLVSLPPIPLKLSHYPFVGAVGIFRLLFERTQIPYRQGQPFLVRGELTGDGNFPEISSLPLQLDPSMKLLSEQVFSDSQYGRTRKVFEWSIETNESSIPNWNPGSVLFFDPFLKEYQLLAFPSFSFVSLPEVKLPQSALQKTFIDFQLEPDWTVSGPWYFRKETLWIQAGVILLTALVIGWTQALKVITVRRVSPEFRRRSQKKKADKALRNQNWEVFFPLAIPLAQFARESNPLLNEAVEALVQANRELRFSPEKTLSLSLDSLTQAWQRVSRSI